MHKEFTSHQANAWRKKYGYKYPLGVIPPEKKEEKKDPSFKNKVKKHLKKMVEATERFKVGDLVRLHGDNDEAFYGKIINVFGTTAVVEWNNKRVERLGFHRLDHLKA